MKARGGVVFSLGLVVVYVVAARGIGNLFPLSTFEMYGSEAADSASRIVVRDAQGRLVEVDDFTALECSDSPSADVTACVDQWPFGYTPAEDNKAIAHVGAASPVGAGGETVAIVRRIWRFDSEGPPTHVDCTLAMCRGRR